MNDMNVMFFTVKMFVEMCTLWKHVKNTHCRLTRHTIVPHAVKRSHMAVCLMSDLSL